MNRTFPSWNRPRQPAVAGSTRAVDPSAQRADGYRLLVAVVVLDLVELGIDPVVALRRLAARIARGTGVPRRLLRGGHGREQRLRGFLQRLGLGLDLRLVVALHRGLELGDRTLDAADQVARHLVAVVLDRAARAVDQRVGLVAGGDKLLELPVFLAMRLGVADHALDLVVRQAGTRSEEHTSDPVT